MTRVTLSDTLQREHETMKQQINELNRKPGFGPWIDVTEFGTHVGYSTETTRWGKLGGRIEGGSVRLRGQAHISGGTFTWGKIFKIPPELIPEWEQEISIQIYVEGSFETVMVNFRKTGGFGGEPLAFMVGPVGGSIVPNPLPNGSNFVFDGVTYPLN